MTASFAAGLLEAALEDQANIVNAEMLARERGIEITESASNEAGNFSTLITASIMTENGELTASGTTFGHEFLRLVRLGNFHLDAYLDGLMLIYRHRDVPGLIGFIGTILGKHKVNIAHMARPRNQQAGGRFDRCPQFGQPAVRRDHGRTGQTRRSAGGGTGPPAARRSATSLACADLIAANSLTRGRSRSGSPDRCRVLWHIACALCAN